MEKLYELTDRDVLLLLLQTAAPVDYDGQRCGCDAGGGGDTKRFPSAVTSSAKSGNYNRTRRDWS